MLPASTVQELRKVTSARICNMYGPTEATISGPRVLTCEFLHSHWKADCRAPDLHSACELAPVPVGVGRGEPQEAPGVARGYQQLEATAERFIAHPFSPAGGERLYRTETWRAI